MIHVHYTDGSEEHYNTVAEAEEGISETVFGCDFAVMVEEIEDDEGRDLGCTFSVKLEER